MSSLRGVRSPIAATSAALVCLAILAGCGEKDEPATTGPVVTTETSTTSTDTTSSSTTTTAEDPATTPAKAVEAFLVSPDADLVCDELITAKFLRASYGDRTGCIAARKPATLASSAGLAATGTGNVVTAQPRGGIYDGEKLTFTTVPAAGGFAIDSVKSNAPVGP